MVHDMFVGCCHVKGCLCLGMDGTGPFCTPILHAEEHGAFEVRPAPRTPLEAMERRHGRVVTSEERARIIALKRDGHGSRTICRRLDINRNLVREVIIEEFGKGPSAEPRMRPRRDDQRRAFDAGITHEEWVAERVEGGRAHTIDALNEWIAERAA